MAISLKKGGGEQRADQGAPVTLTFPWSRTTTWRRTKALMAQAAITGPQATPRGLRHRYGVHAIMHGVDEDLLRRLLGHAPNSKSTRIYLKVMGDEEREIVQRMWR